MIRFITLLNASYHNWIAQTRAFFFRPFFKHIGKNVLFREGFKFQSAKQISIGHHVFINHGVEIAGAGGVKIGNYILIGPNVLIVTTIHQTVDTAVPMFTQTFGGNDKYKPVTIEDDVWIGAKAVILPGIHIGKGAASFLLKNILLHEKKLDIGNGIEPSGQKICPEGSTRWPSTQYFRSNLQVIYQKRKEHRQKREVPSHEATLLPEKMLLETMDMTC